ncbi:uncharacterized protein KZ484_008938 [Pholidichthys leucotaenia]
MILLCIILLILHKICQVYTSSLIQESGIKIVKAGENVTFHCRCRDDAVTFMSWYQQSLGDKPHIISSRMRHGEIADIHPDFEERYSVFAQNEEGTNTLTITDLRLSDTATYYCGVLVFNAIEFGEGVFLHVKSPLSDKRSAVHQHSLESVRLGASLNLSCRVNAKGCAGEHSLYWFRHRADQPAVVYPSEGLCTGSHSKNCTLNLAFKSVTPSDTGTYYCALASCGEIIFGSGTRVEIEVSSLLEYCLCVVLAVSIAIILMLVCCMYKIKKNTCPVCKGTAAHLTRSGSSDALNQEEGSLHYAAVNVKRNSEQHHQEDKTETVCVYTSVKSKNQ